MKQALLRGDDRREAHQFLSAGRIAAYVIKLKLQENLRRWAGPVATWDLVVSMLDDAMKL